MIAGRSGYTKLRMILDDGSYKDLYYSYVLKLKYHMGELLTMPKEYKIKFITIYLCLKYSMQYGLSAIEIDQFGICIDHIRSWPKEIKDMEWSLAQTDKLLKNLLGMEFFPDGIECISTDIKRIYEQGQNDKPSILIGQILSSGRSFE